MKKLIIIGAGGYAKSVLDSIDYSKYEVCGFIDDFTKAKEHLGIEIIGNSLNNIKNKEQYCYFVAIGNNINRKKWFDNLVNEKLNVINVIDKTAIISKNANIGKGCFFGKMSIVNSGSTIGDNVIVNTKALVEHGCMVGNHCNLSTNSVINGETSIGEGSFIGSSSVVIGQLHIGKWSTIGAGAVVIRDIEDNVTAVGIPAKTIKKGANLG